MIGTVRLASILTLALLILAVTSPAAIGQQSTPAEEEISATDLEAALETLEDREALEALKAQLRAILAAKQAAAPGPPQPEPAPLTRKIVLAIIQIQGTIGKLPSDTIGVLRQIGPVLGNISKRLGEPEYRYEILKLVVKLVVALAAAVAVFVFLHLLLRRLRGAAARTDALWRGRLALAALSVGTEMAAPIALYVFAGMFLTWGRISQPYTRAFFMFVDYFILYGLLAGVLRGVLCPGDALRRIRPLGEETAAYWARWGRQLLGFVVFGYFVVALLGMYAAGSAASVSVTILYKVGLVVFAAAALSRWRRSIIGWLLVPERWEGPPRGFRQWVWRLYNLAIGRLYWVLLAYIIFLALVTLLGYQQLFTRLLWNTIATVVLVAVGYGVQRLIALEFARAQRGEERLRSRYPELGPRGSRYIRVLYGLALGVVWALFIGFILEAWGIMVFEALSGEVGGLILRRVILSIVIVLLATLFIIICACVVERLMQPKPDATTGEVAEIGQKRRTLLPLLNKVVLYVTLFVAGVLILDQMGINPTPILAGAGIVGLAVGFGAQTLVKDVISGFFILFENQVRVGDVVVIGDKGGLVEAMNLRTLVLRDLAGNVHIIPCGSIDKVMNMTKEYSRYVLDLGVSYREDVDEVMEVVKGIFDDLMRDPHFGPDIIEPLEILGVDDFGDSQVTIKMRITTKPIKQWRVARELRRRIKKIFDERGIEIPFPHRTIYMGEPKKTPPPPLHVKLEGETESALLGPEEVPEPRTEHEDDCS